MPDRALLATRGRGTGGVRYLQDIIHTLDRFWAGQGCLIWFPYDVEKGAGTMNPATFLRVLGPEPWRVAYVEPSRRPADGRYGENPNRLYQHLQYQVIMKPSPDDIQDVYLESLEAIGLDRRSHDIRFVEDNWESPTLGASGQGWEVWADGMEITQFTYFQTVGGRECRPVAVEITYGLERLAAYIQGVEDIYRVALSPQMTYHDLFRRNEWEQSRYSFEVADVALMRQLFDAYEAEATRCLEAGLLLPAYDYVLKCSHTFNILDARGAVSLGERTSYLTRCRHLARRCADLYLEQREEAGYPWRDRWGEGPGTC